MPTSVIRPAGEGPPHSVLDQQSRLQQAKPQTAAVEPDDLGQGRLRPRRRRRSSVAAVVPSSVADGTAAAARAAAAAAVATVETDRAVPRRASSGGASAAQLSPTPTPAPAAVSSAASVEELARQHVAATTSTVSHAVKVGSHVICLDKPCGKLVHGFNVRVHPYTRRTALAVPGAEYPKFLAAQGRALQLMHQRPHPRVIKLVGSVDPRAGTDDDGYLIFPPLYGDLTRSSTMQQPRPPPLVAAAASAAGLAPLFKRMLEAVGHCHELGIAVRGIVPASFGWSDEQCSQVVLSGIGGAEVVAAPGAQREARRASHGAGQEAASLRGGGSDYEYLHRGGGVLGPMAAFMRGPAATAFARDLVGLAEVFHFLLRQAGYDSPRTRPVPGWALALLRKMLETDPALQPSATELAEADWFRWAAEAHAHAHAQALLAAQHGAAALASGSRDGRGRQSPPDEEEEDQCVPVLVQQPGATPVCDAPCRRGSAGVAGGANVNSAAPLRRASATTVRATARKVNRRRSSQSKPGSHAELVARAHAYERRLSASALVSG